MQPRHQPLPPPQHQHTDTATPTQPHIHSLHRYIIHTHMHTHVHVPHAWASSANAVVHRVRVQSSMHSARRHHAYARAGTNGTDIVWTHAHTRVHEHTRSNACTRVVCTHACVRHALVRVWVCVCVGVGVGSMHARTTPPPRTHAATPSCLFP